MTDLDIVPALDKENKERLVEALKDVHAKEKRADSVEDAFDLLANPSSLTDTGFWTFITDFGELDIVLRPEGFPRGYDDLVGNVQIVRLEDYIDGNLGVDVVMADVQDVYDSKRLAAREKDVKALPLFAGIHSIDIKETMREKYRQDQAQRTSSSPSSDLRDTPPSGPSGGVAP